MSQYAEIQLHDVKILWRLFKFTIYLMKLHFHKAQNARACHK